MDIFLLGNGRLTTNSQWLNYATSRLKEMFQCRQIRKAVLVPEQDHKRFLTINDQFDDLDEW